MCHPKSVFWGSQSLYGLPKATAEHSCTARETLEQKAKLKVNLKQSKRRCTKDRAARAFYALARPRRTPSFEAAKHKMREYNCIRRHGMPTATNIVVSPFRRSHPCRRLLLPLLLLLLVPLLPPIRSVQRLSLRILSLPYNTVPRPTLLALHLVGPGT